MIHLLSCFILVLLIHIAQFQGQCSKYDPGSPWEMNAPTWDKFSYKLLRDAEQINPAISFVFQGIPLWQGPNIGLFFKTTTGLQTDANFDNNFLTGKQKSLGLDSVPNCYLTTVQTAMPLIFDYFNSSTKQILKCDESKPFQNSNYFLTQNLATCTQDLEIRTNFSVISSFPEFWKSSYVSLTWFFGFFGASTLNYGDLSIFPNSYGKEIGNMLNRKLFWKEEHSVQFNFNSQSLGKNDTDPEILVSEIDTYAKSTLNDKSAYFMLSIQTFKGFRVSSIGDEGFNDLFFVPLSGHESSSTTQPPTSPAQSFMSQLNFESSLFLHDTKSSVSVFIMKYMMLSSHVFGYVNFKGQYCRDSFLNTTTMKCDSEKAVAFQQKFDNLEFRASVHETMLPAVVSNILNLRFSHDISTRIVLGSEKSANYLLLVLDFPYESFYCKNIEFELIETSSSGKEQRFDLINGPSYTVAKALGDVPRQRVPQLFANNVVILFELDNSFGFFSNIAKPARFKINWKIQEKPTARAVTAPEYLMLKGFSFKITETDFKMDYRAPTALYGPTNIAVPNFTHHLLFGVLLCAIFTLL